MCQGMCQKMYAIPVYPTDGSLMLVCSLYTAFCRVVLPDCRKKRNECCDCAANGLKYFLGELTTEYTEISQRTPRTLRVLIASFVSSVATNNHHKATVCSRFQQICLVKAGFVQILLAKTDHQGKRKHRTGESRNVAVPGFFADCPDEFFDSIPPHRTMRNSIQD